MGPNIFKILNEDAQSRAKIGLDDNGDIKVYPYQRAPENIKKENYAVFTTDTLPQNNLSTSSKVDQYNFAIFCYSNDQREVIDMSIAIRDALEKVGYVNSLRQDYNFDTRKYIMIMDIDIFYDR